MGTNDFLLAGAAIAFVYEMVALYRDDLILISEGYRRLGVERTPAVVYAWGVLVGHFFVQPPAYLVPASILPELVEVGWVLSIGGIIFWAFRKRRDSLPLPWWGYALLLVFGGVMGSMFWTMTM